MTSCRGCGGLAEVECVVCEGDGIDPATEEKCTECDGNGYEDCESCDGTGEEDS
jgi:RecJ-like exonuclease